MKKADYLWSHCRAISVQEKNGLTQGRGRRGKIRHGKFQILAICARNTFLDLYFSLK